MQQTKSSDPFTSTQAWTEIAAVPVLGAVSALALGLSFGLFSGAAIPADADAESLNVANAENSINLFRAVKPDELAQILQTNAFENPYGIINKYFTTSFADAQKYGLAAEKAFGDPPYSIVQTTIQNTNFQSLAPELLHIVEFGIQAVLIPTSELPVLSEPEIISNTVTLPNMRMP